MTKRETSSPALALGFVNFPKVSIGIPGQTHTIGVNFYRGDNWDHLKPDDYQQEINNFYNFFPRIIKIHSIYRHKVIQLMTMGTGACDYS